MDLNSWLNFQPEQHVTRLPYSYQPYFKESTRIHAKNMLSVALEKSQKQNTINSKKRLCAH